MNKSDQVIEFFNHINLCSEFDNDRQVSESDMRTILEVGRLSPSSFGLEPWQFLVIKSYIRSPSTSFLFALFLFYNNKYNKVNNQAR